jgi:hypothetical protein
MGKACDYLHLSESTTTFPNRNQAQSLTRRQCHLCKIWFDPAKGLKCECPDRQNKTLRGKPRVSEAELAVQEAYPDNYDSAQSDREE